MPKRILFISDIHGQLVTLERLLANVEFDSETDQLILLGDYIGRNRDNLASLDRVRDLVQSCHAIALLGNHELELLRSIQAQKQNQVYQPKYGYIYALANDVLRVRSDVESFLSHMPLWYENEDFIAVHAGLNPSLLDWRQSTVDEFTSIRSPFIHAQLPTDKTVIFGHTPCSVLHGSSDIWFGAGKIGIDGGAGHDIQLNCLAYGSSGCQTQSLRVIPVTGFAHKDVPDSH